MTGGGCKHGQSGESVIAGEDPNPGKKIIAF